MSQDGRHWLTEWIDEFGIRTEDDVFRLERSGVAIKRLHAIAEAARNKPVVAAGQAIVAGSTMDLSGTLTCSHANCQRDQIDKLFGKVWHYFDQIVVEGVNAHSMAHKIENASKADRLDLFYSIWQQVQILLYLREIGAEKYLIFRDRDDGYCAKHGREYAAASGLGALLEESYKTELVNRIRREADIDIVWRDGYGLWSYHIAHPSFPQRLNGSIVAGRGKKKPTKRQVIDDLVTRATIALASDLNVSRELTLPLAQETEFLWSGLSDGTSGSSVDVRNVALRLPLPVIHGLPARDIVKLREDERPHFERFQSALTKAIREQIARGDSGSPEEIARDVQEEFIKPALAAIERSLDESKKALSRKTSLTLSVGSVAATAGALTSVPLMLAAGVGAIFTMSLGGVTKYVDEKRDVAMSDVYFLWKAQRDFSKH